MAFDPSEFNSTNYIAAAAAAADANAPPTTTAALDPIFRVELVQLQAQVGADFVAVQVANNVIILALTSGRLLRIDLASPENVDDIDLPRKPSEVGTIRKIFLDPTASHLFITTTHGENFYLHSRSSKARHLGRLKSLHIECVAWSPALPTTSTREILLGTQDGSVYETFIDGLDDGGGAAFMRKDEKYLKQVYKMADNSGVTGLWVDALPGKSELRRVLVATAGAVMHWVGRVQRHSDVGSIFARFFEAEGPMIQDFHDTSTPFSALCTSPDSADPHDPDRSFAWLCSPGIYHGRLLTSPPNPDLGAHVLSTSKLFPSTALSSQPNSIALTHHHVLAFSGTTLYAINRLDDSIVFSQSIVDPGTRILGICADLKKCTYWVFTASEIYEVVVVDEERDLWRILLKERAFERAMRYAKTPAQRDAVAVGQGEYLVRCGRYEEAAGVWGGCSKSFEEVALTFLERGEQDALRRYLLVKLGSLKKSAVMQRIMTASWLVEVFMAKLNTLEDSLSTLATHATSSITTSADITAQLASVRSEYQSFITAHKDSLDRKTTYEIISSHGRKDELLHYANTISDYSYVLAYWIQREQWHEALSVLKKQTDPEMFYKYASVLLSNAPTETVDILMRQGNLTPRNLIPALLNYNKYTRAPLNANQAVRYLLFVIHQHGSTDAAVHNTLLSIYASHPSRDETHLLSYLETHTASPHYDADFALRLCIRHNHVLSCVHLYSSMGLYLQAVELALKHGNLTLASIVADRPSTDTALRKQLWLAVARAVIASSSSIKAAIDFLRRCELLKIEDLIPFFPDFVVIDDFKDEICAALEDHSHAIDTLKREMEESARTAANIRRDVELLDRRYAIVEPGERCWLCQMPLLARLFYVFPCQHAFHSDCLTGEVLRGVGPGKGRRVRDAQERMERGMVGGRIREKAVEEFDSLVASECVLCSEFAIKRIDEAFVTPQDDLSEWAV
ncbi:uncharacterized protein H6S33_002956 [Morchella sextelata]|uniref:uncharacterized protein n=1 Tax=Morchella sextelata TaxID=1174677 RepID=UPI001D05AD42|nr:uncharacterized protein H6S33_002956 [Morchella sextelata]KAH0606968.1 hypothetical protein H6S33_002956 [Morchella sextelata]